MVLLHPHRGPDPLPAAQKDLDTGNTEIGSEAAGHLARTEHLVFRELDNP